MHDFRFRKNELYCEGVKVSLLAEKFGTPLYVYSHKTLVEHFDKLKKAFADLKPMICFSVKSNSNLAILKSLVSRGAGLDIVSGGELYRAKKIGADPKKIVYASVGKTEAEIREAIKCGIFSFNVESLEELDSINQLAGRLKKRARVCIRINPNVDPETHRYITTGTIESKFGVDFDTARIIFLNRDNFKNVSLIGLHVHIGSQITQVRPYLAVLERAGLFVSELKRMGIGLEWFNIGGGLGIIYNDEKPQTAEEFAGKVKPILKKIGLRVILEPGRFIVGNAGILATRVIYTKDTKIKRFVVVDAGMNDLIRPSLYEAYHEIVPVLNPADKNFDVKKTDIVGPICESGDFLAKARQLPRFKSGVLLAVMSAGAYGFSMASNYNSRRRAAEVLVKGNKFYLIRSRETYSDLVRSEKAVSL